MKKLLQKHNIRQSTEQFEEWLQQKQALRKSRMRTMHLQAGPYKIPVVFHIIHNGEALGTGANIPDARVFSQIEVLNKDFTRTNTDAINTPAEFLSVAGSMNIEFVLAKQAPDGSATTGINRVNGNRSTWPPFDENLCALSYWPSEDYLNIWVTNIGSNFLGYAQFPVSNLSGLEEYQDGVAETDGVVIDYTVFGVGSSDPDYDNGRTTTHEIGHFFGLRHIWGDESGCAGTDYVNDTPNQLDETLGCPNHPVIDCSNNKMFQNYMDYTDDECMNLFTVQQIDRMTLILEDTSVPRRNSLLNSIGLDDPIPGTIDLEVIRLTRPGPISCDFLPILNLDVLNNSTETIHELKIKINVNGGNQQIITIDNLNINGAATLTIQSPGLSIGENSVVLNVVQINRASDPVPSNNQLTSNLTIIHPECEPFAVYPDGTGKVNITFSLSEQEPVTISLVDMMGREITSATYPEILNQTITLPGAYITRGLYMVRIHMANRYYTTKVYLSP
ncbi:MAG TPA: M43 family zinc metalloprotease [Cyclobacteriaceae bacterium]